MSVGFPNFFKDLRNVSTELLYVVLVVTVFDGPEYWEMACTGTLIRADLVLTAAPCLMRFGSMPDPENTIIYERPLGSFRKAIKIFIHPDCMDSHNFNFAVITIEQSTQTSFPALPRAGQVLEKGNPNCLLSGYGKPATLTLGNFKAIRLGETPWTVLKCRATSKEECVLCLHFSSIIPCRDDIGSPIICNGTVVAMYIPRILSLSSECSEKYAIHFLYVSSVLKWLDTIVNARDYDLTWLNNSWYFLLLCAMVLVSVVAIYCGVVEVMQRTIDVRDSIVEPKNKTEPKTEPVREDVDEDVDGEPVDSYSNTNQLTETNSPVAQEPERSSV